MEDTEISVEETTHLVNESGNALNEIVRFVDDTNFQIQSIATASEEQSATSEEINRAVSEVHSLAQEIADEIDETSNYINELATQSIELTKVFKQLMAKKKAPKRYW